MPRNLATKDEQVLRAKRRIEADRSFDHRRANENSGLNELSLQDKLIQRAIEVASNKRIVFKGEAADWLRELVEATVHNIFNRLGDGAIAMTDDVLRLIEKSYQEITLLVSSISAKVKSGEALTLSLLQEIYRLLCPLPPLCE